MSKTIQLVRRELVWETRENEFGEYEWENYKKELAGLVEQYKNRQSLGSWEKDNISTYNFIKDITWDEAYEIYRKEKEDGIECTLKLEHRRGEGENAWSYFETLVDIMEELIREDNYDADISDYDYADDYDEDYYFNEADDKDEEEDNENKGE